MVCQLQVIVGLMAILRLGNINAKLLIFHDLKISLRFFL